MKRKYFVPRIEVMDFEDQNILTASGGGTTALDEVKGTVTGSVAATISADELRLIF